MTSKAAINGWPLAGQSVLGVGNDSRISPIPPTGGGAAPWTPLALGSALALWSDAKDQSSIDTVEGQIAQVNDKGPGGNHRVQAVGQKQPFWQSGEILYDGVDDLLATASNFPIVGATPRHVFSVARRIAGGPIVYWGAQTALQAFGLSFNGPTTGAIAYVWGGNDLAFGAYTDGKQLLYAGNDGANTLGGLNGSTSLSSVANVPNTAAGLLYTGARPVGSISYAQHSEIELIIVTGVLDTATRQKIEGYLAWANGLQALLPANHPYKAARP